MVRSITLLDCPAQLRRGLVDVRRVHACRYIFSHVICLFYGQTCAVIRLRNRVGERQLLPGKVQLRFVTNMGIKVGKKTGHVRVPVRATETRMTWQENTLAVHSLI